MKIFTTLTTLFIFSTVSVAQVGINTTDPTSTLDVNGTLRVRGSFSVDGTNASSMMGVDEDGNFINLEIGRNLRIDDNTLHSDDTDYTIERDLDVVPGEEIHNLVVLPGGPVIRKKIIRLRTAHDSPEITGIEAAPDGTTIILYPTQSKIKLEILNENSLPQNQILSHNDFVVQQYGTVELFYDGELQKWIIIDNN